MRVGSFQEDLLDFQEASSFDVLLLFLSALQHVGRTGYCDDMDFFPFPPPPKPADILLFPGGTPPPPLSREPTGNSAEMAGSMSYSARKPTATFSTPNHTSGGVPLHTLPAFVASTNATLDAYSSQVGVANRIQHLERQLRYERQRNDELSQELLWQASHYVPPREFLPPPFYEDHGELIDKINDYALLYRSVTLPLLQKRVAALRHADTGSPQQQQHSEQREGHSPPTSSSPPKDSTTGGSQAPSTGHGVPPVSQTAAVSPESTIQYLKERVTQLTSSLQAAETSRPHGPSGLRLPQPPVPDPILTRHRTTPSGTPSQTTIR